MNLEPESKGRGPGRPRVCGNRGLLDILQDLKREGVEQLSTPDVVAELQIRLPCSRRTAYRIITRAAAEGAIVIA